LGGGWLGDTLQHFSKGQQSYVSGHPTLPMMRQVAGADCWRNIPIPLIDLFCLAGFGCIPADFAK
jgi:hypothetical protein